MHFVAGKISDDLPHGAYTLTIEASAQVCTEGACLPGKATIPLFVTIVTTDTVSHPANSESFKSFDSSRAP